MITSRVPILVQLALASLALMAACFQTTLQAQRAGPATPELQLTFDGSLQGRSGNGTTISPVKFSRASPASYWDDSRQKLVIVPGDTPRFERYPGNPHGPSRGVLLEGEASNYALQSSFESADALKMWRTQGLSAELVSDGVEGSRALRLAGKGRLYEEISLPVEDRAPFRNLFSISFYARRADGGTIDSGIVRPLAVTDMAEQSQFWQGDTPAFEKKGNGPWTRVSVRFGKNGGGPPPARWFIGVEVLQPAQLVIDAVQLEAGRGINQAAQPTSYIPTTDAAAQRAGDLLSYDFSRFLSSDEGSAALWVRPNASNGYFLDLHGNASGPYCALSSAAFSIGGALVRLQKEYFPKPREWTNLAVTWKRSGAGGTADLLVNGADRVNQAEGPVPYPKPPVFGTLAYVSKPGNEPNGLIAGLLLFRRSLVADDLRQILGLQRPMRAAAGCASATARRVTFDVPMAGLVSVNVTKTDGTLLRRAVIGQHMSAGRQSVTWDGLDETCRAVSGGDYRVSGLVANIGVKYLATLGNTSPQPYGGTASSEGGEYREGDWHDVIVNPDGTFYILSSEGEAPPTLQLIDPAREYRVAWAGSTYATGAGLGFQQVGARDASYLYFVIGACTDKPGQHLCTQVLARMDAKTHQVVPFAGGKSTVQLTDPADFPRKLGSFESDVWDVRGLAASGGQVFVPRFRENHVDIYDGNSGRKTSEIVNPALNGPSDAWVCRDRTLLIIDRRAVHRFSLDGRYLGTPVQGLRQGWSVTEGSQGEIIASDAGADQVRYFSREGKPLRTVGAPDAPAASHPAVWLTNDSSSDPRKWVEVSDWTGGKVADDRFFRPEGIAVDGNGNLVVADYGNGRIQVFDALGRLKKSILAQVYSSFLVDPQRPNPVFVSGEARGLLREYDMDWTSGVHKLLAQWTPIPSGPHGTQFVKWRGDQPYFFLEGRIIYTIEHDRPRVCTVIGYDNEPSTFEERGTIVSRRPADLSPNRNDPYAFWEWRDLNGDGKPEPGEYKYYVRSASQRWWGVAYPHDFEVDDEWNLIVKADESAAGTILMIPFQGFDSAGNPIYSWRAAKLLFKSDVADPLWTADLSQGKPARPQLGGFYYDARQNLSCLVLNDRPEYAAVDAKFRCYKDGRRLFSFGKGVPGYWNQPGTEISLSMQMPRAIGEFIFVTDTPSMVHIFTRQGLYAGTLLKTGLVAEESKQDPEFRLKNVAGEMWWTHVFRHPQTGRVYLLTQGNAEPMVRAWEITGLDQARFFSGQVQ